MSDTFKAPQLRRPMRLIGMIAIAVAVLIVGSCGVKWASHTVEPGNVGVRIRTLGANAGVDPVALRSGWQWVGLGEKIIEYPVIQRTYTYTKEADERGPENEEIVFSDNQALPMTADVQAVIRVRTEAAPRLYTKYRLTFDELLHGPIRNDIRTAIAAESELMQVTQLYTGGRQAMIHRALARIQRKWAVDGVDISQLDWIGPIRYPPVILEAIQATTKANADQVAAQARVAVATANALAVIEEAKGRAEANRLNGEMLRAYPELVQRIYAERSSGICPPSATTCIVGAGAWGLVPEGNRNAD